MTENQHPDRSRRLGRGLSALIGSPQTTAASAPAPEPFREIRLDLIEPNPLQPRRDFPDDEIRELQASMQASGLIQPVTVAGVEMTRAQIADPDLVAKLKEGKGHPKVAKSDAEIKAAVDAALSVK